MEFQAAAGSFQELRCRLDPVWAHLIGSYEHADRYPDVSRAAEEAAIEQARGLAALAAVRAGEDSEHTLGWELIEWEAGSRAEVLSLRLAELDVDPLFGPVASLPAELPRMALPNAEVAALVPAKLESFAQHLHDSVDRLRDGLGGGRVPPRFAVEATMGLATAWLARPLTDDPLLRLPTTSTDTDRAGLLDAVAAVVARSVRPALAAYAAFLRGELAPSARPDERCGLAFVEGGDAAYATLAAAHTTTSLGVEEVHRIGLDHVAALRDEYAEVGSAALGISDPDEVMETLRGDPALHFETVEEVVAAAETALARATAAAGASFGLVPRAGCTVEAATSGSLAYYFRPPRDGSRGGICFVNLSDPSAWARYEIEALMFHEGVPGHHLQIGLAGELDHLPEFRRTGRITGYSEGWGLYAERLADELGLYSSPLERLGMLSFDSLRACRLVVDTGLHAMGWSRGRAWRYLHDNSPLSAGHVAAEVDRYVVTPGQALAYLVGRREILRIRAEAKGRLGPRFDLARFHDAVLGEGQLPLPLLDQQVRAALG